MTFLRISGDARPVPREARVKKNEARF